MHRAHRTKMSSRTRQSGTAKQRNIHRARTHVHFNERVVLAHRLGSVLAGGAQRALQRRASCSEMAGAKMGGEKRTQCNGAHERTSTTCDRAANDTSSARKNSAQQRDAERRHSECEILRTHTHTAPSSSSIGAVSSLAAFDSSRKLTIMSWSASKRSTNVGTTHRRRTQVRSTSTIACRQKAGSRTWYRTRTACVMLLQFRRMYCVKGVFAHKE